MTCPNVQLGPVLVEGWCRKSSPSLSMYGVRGSGETVEITADGVVCLSPPLAAFRTLTAPYTYTQSVSTFNQSLSVPSAPSSFHV